MPYTIQQMAKRLEAAEKRIDHLEARMPDKKFIQEEFKFLREQSKLTNKTLDVILTYMKLHEDREVDYDRPD